LFSKALTLAKLAVAETPPDITLCKAQPNERRCYYVYRYEDTREYKQPDISSQPLPSWGWGNTAQIDWPRAETAPPGWLPTWTGDYHKRLPYGWAEIKHLARPDEFRRVTGCWPVAYLEDELGDALLTVKFKPDGQAVLGVGIRTEVLFAPNLILIIDKRFKNGGYNFLGFDPKTRRLRQPTTGKAPQKVRYFPAKQLIGCDEGVKLQN